MIASFTNFIETSSNSEGGPVTNKDKLASVDNIIEALKCVSDEYESCEANVNDVVAACEAAKVDACWKCTNPSIHFKSVYLPVAPANLAEYRKELSAESPDGYCERSLQNMNVISNQRVCASSTKEDIGFHYKIEFGLQNDTTMTFNVPVDFDYGGYSVLDDETQVEYKGDIWGSDPLGFTADVLKGPHTLEVIGGEGCCDGEQQWSFEMDNSGVKEQFTLRNLATLCPT